MSDFDERDASDDEPELNEEEVLEQLQELPPHAKPSPKVVVEVWDSKAVGDDIFIGSCDTDIAKIRFETRSELSWHRLSDRTRARRANVGEIKFSIAWGPNEPTILTVQIEEGFALTKHLQAGFMNRGKKTSRLFGKKKADEKQEDLLPSAFLKVSCVRACTCTCENNVIIYNNVFAS